jgi:hypothetical protein
VRRDVLEVRSPLLVPRHSIAIVLDREIVLPVLAAAGDRDGLGVSVDAVLDELGDRLQGIALRERNDTDRVPVIPDLELAAVGMTAPVQASALELAVAQPGWQQAVPDIQEVGVTGNALIHVGA